MSTKTAGALTVVAPAKINLYLGVHTEKDERAYHRVDSVMAALGLADMVYLAPAFELSVRTFPAVDVPIEQNTAYRAAQALGEAFGRAPQVSIEIEKHIPLQAGLGGPSTDAAATLVGLCHLWNIDPIDERVVAVARGIGADVPFFLSSTLAYCDGAGDVVCEEFDPFEDFPVVLVKPESVGVSAAGAYRRFDEAPFDLAPLDPLLSALRAHDIAGVMLGIANNLAPAACALAPAVEQVMLWLREQSNILAVQVTGSGACVFALCASHAAAERIARVAREAYGWWACATTMAKSGVVVQMS